MMIEEAIELMDVDKYDRVVVVALKEHVDQYSELGSLEKGLKKQ